ncbi:hypothetical protein NEAUS03_0529 [Nematocida ausubeli]|nr:hypothetical protein NEAUS03_0529 [Nematocida ausubeli]
MKNNGSGKSISHIVTHDGAFHLDDVLACFILRVIYPNAKITRTRDPEKIKTGHIVVDVGGEFNEKTLRYDHHQRGFKETYNQSNNIILSSAGLVYKYHGLEFIKKLGLELPIDFDYPMLMEILYDTYFVSVDANDNGIDIADEVRYNERSLDNVIRSFVPCDIPEGTSFERASIMRYQAFESAMEYIGQDLLRHCKNMIFQIIKNSRATQECFNSMKDPSARYLVMEGGKFPVREILYYYNGLLQRNVSIVIYQVSGRYSHTYKIICLPKKGVKYTPEIPLCEEWRGIRDQELQKYPNMMGAMFVHGTGFCGEASDLETAIYMVERSIEVHMKRQKGN